MRRMLALGQGTRTMVGVAGVGSGNDCLIVRKGEDIKDWKALTTKAIGVGAGSISWLKFAASTRENGVHYAKRKVINIMGGDVEIVEAGALDGLDRERIAALAPEGDDEILVTGRAAGFDAHVAPRSPYEEHDPAAVRRAAQPLRAGNAGLVVMDCIGFRRKTRDEMAALTGAPTLVADLLVARVAAELLGR